MKINNGKIKVIVAVIALTVAVVTACLIWHYFYPTYYKYNDRFIIGNDISSIVEKYGEFDKVFYSEREETKGKIAKAGYLIREEKLSFGGTDPAEYYMIYFNFDGEALSVKRWLDNIGG